TPTDLEAIELAAADVTAAGLRADLADVTTANRAFHFLLFDAAGLPRLSRTLRQLWDATDVYRSVYFAAPANRSRVNDEHDELIAALRLGDVRAAIAAQASHRAHSVEAVSNALTS
ncbi:MAG: FCD domain-containing protein, partial [Actinomycetes bacterium]